MAAWEVLEHTADIGVRARGETLARLFENAAAGMVEIAFDPASVADRGRRAVAAEAPDRETLLVNFLDEILWLIDGERWLPCRVTVHEVSETRISAIAFGEPRDPVGRGHVLRTIIKAVTFHLLSVRQPPATEPRSEQSAAFAPPTEPRLKSAAADEKERFPGTGETPKAGEDARGPRAGEDARAPAGEDENANQRRDGEGAHGQGAGEDTRAPALCADSPHGTHDTPRSTQHSAHSTLPHGTHDAQRSTQHTARSTQHAAHSTSLWEAEVYFDI